MPSYPPVAQILDTSYVQNLAKRAAPSKVAVRQAAPAPQVNKPVSRVVSRKSWQIPFQSGRAEFSPAASKALERLRQDLLVASGTVVEVHGHTDAQGNPQANMSLSEQRAFAVANWLSKKFPANFPEGRVRVFAHGQQNPVAPNASEAGRARNRRVEVILATTD
jgi:outer membrane protein OmpA-like peptidoglycan-associated protein